jgi:hypothetical protein
VQVNAFYPLHVSIDRIRYNIEKSTLDPQLVFDKFYRLLKHSDAPSGPKFVIIPAINRTEFGLVISSFYGESNVYQSQRTNPT